MDSKKTIPSEVINIIETLNGGGYEAYMVGGCVRDMLMGKAPKDWDITTSATPTEIKSLFPRTFDTGIEHGTVTVVLSKQNFEVTTYRIDGNYLDNRRPSEVFFTGKLEEDLLRRDFTMNAIAFHPRDGYIDPYGGMDDISARLIRGVGNADTRFKEDGLRMMRAVRFASQLNFEIEESTWAAIPANAALIKNISMERVRDEFLKLLLGPHPEKHVLLSAGGLMKFIDPELDAALQEPITVLNFLEADTALRLAAVFKNLPDNDSRMKNFRLDNKTAKLISKLINFFDTPWETDYHMRRLMSLVGVEDTPKVLQFRLAYAQAAEEKFKVMCRLNPCTSLKQLALKGGDLPALGVPPGEKIGKALGLLLEHVLHHPQDNTPEALKAVLANCLPYID